MKSVSMKAGLWLIGLVCTVGMLLLSVTSIHFANSSEKTLRNFVGQSVALRNSSTVLYANGLQRGQALRNIFLNPTNAKAYENLEAAKINFDAEIKVIFALLSQFPDQAKFANQIKEQAEQWTPLQDKIVSLIKEGQKDSAQDLLVSKETTHWRQLRSDILSISKMAADSAHRDEELMFKELNDSRTISIILIALSLAFVVLAIHQLGRIIYRQVGGEPLYAASVLSDFAKGDLSRHVVIADGDKDSIIATMDIMRRQIGYLISETSNTANSVATESEELKLDAKRLSSTAEEQSLATAAIAAAVEEFTVSIRVMSESANDAGILANRSEQQAHETLNVVSVATTTIQQVSTDMANAALKMEELSAKVHDITGIVDKIRDIADQTNLLALNAAIEAARAGELGRGFAVVADEVRKLAELTTKSTQEITGIVTSVRNTTDEASETMLQANQRAQTSAASTNEVRDAVIALDGASMQVGCALESIAGSLREQTAASTDIAQRVEVIAQGIEHTHHVATDSEKRSHNLVALSQQLTECIQRFRIS